MQVQFTAPPFPQPVIDQRKLYERLVQEEEQAQMLVDTKPIYSKQQCKIDINLLLQIYCQQNVF